jgi:hypothetical protein
MLEVHPSAKATTEVVVVRKTEKPTWSMVMWMRSSAVLALSVRANSPEMMNVLSRPMPNE